MRPNAYADALAHTQNYVSDSPPLHPAAKTFKGINKFVCLLPNFRSPSQPHSCHIDIACTRNRAHTHTHAVTQLNSMK